MSVPAQTPSKEYIANGTTTAFPLEFNCDKAEYLIVTLNGEDAPVGSWTLANDTVTFNVAPLNGVVVNLERNTPFQRTTNYKLYDNSFRPSAVNKDFDLIWWKLQELGYRDQVIWLALIKEISDRTNGDIELQNQINTIEQQVDLNTQDIAKLITDLSQEIADRIKGDQILKDMFLSMIDEAINEGTINALAVTHLDSLEALEGVTNVWDGRTIYVKDLGNYRYDARTTSWIKAYQDADNVIDRNESQKEINSITPRYFSSVDEMLAYPHKRNGLLAITKSYHAGLNKGGAKYVYDSSKASINDGVVCIYGWKLNATKLNPYICGAYGDGVADDTVAMKNWLDLTESYGFGEAELPEGSYIYNEVLNVGGTTSIKGCGQKSVLRPTGCHGLNFLRSDAVGARSITDFWIYPQNGTSFYGLYANLNTPTDRITGVLFKNIYVSWMLGTAYLKGVWHSCFENIYSINNYRGIKLVGQNVKVDIKTCWLIRGNTSNIGDNLDSYGVSIEYDSENVRSEDIKISRCIIYGYDRGVNVVSVLNGAIQNCDIDFALSYGIYCSVLDGGFAIQDNWIAITANATSPIYGIYFSALGSAKETTRTITNNYVVHYGSSPVTASTGIYLGSNQRMVKIADNTVLSFSYGIYGDGADYTKILDNTIDAKTYSIFLYSVKNTQINGNFLNQLIFCYPFNVNYTDFGINFSEVNTGLKSTASILSGTTSITINFDKPIYVGLPTYLYPVCEIIGAQGINYTFLGDGTQKTGITFTVGSAPSSDLQFAYKISTFNRIS